MNENKYKIDKETAEDEFERFCDGWEIDTDTSDMTEEDVTGFNAQKNHFVKAVQKNRLSVNDDGTLSYTFSDFSEKKAGETINIRQPKGAAYMEMDNFKEQQGVRKTFSVLSGMTGKSVGYFSGVDGVDLKPLQAVIILFLAG